MAKSEVRQINGVTVLDTISAVIKMAEMVVKLSKITCTFVSGQLSFAAPREAILQEIISDYGIMKIQST